MGKYSIKIWFIPFTASTGAPVNASYVMKHATFLRLELDKNEQRRLLNMLQRKICSGKFNEPFLRLIVIFDNRDIFLMDNDGVVKYRDRQYYISPGAFLSLSNYVESLDHRK